PAKDRDRIPGIDTGVDESAPWRFGSHTARVLEIPAHTRAHIAFAFEDDLAVFTGDTLFSMGCGRLFEGTPQMMWDSLSKLMRLTDGTRGCCGPDRTARTGRFALTPERDNPDLVARTEEVAGLRAKNLPTTPSTLAVEKTTNPFLRPDSRAIRKSLGMEQAS